jgi:ABC-2 type transport system ATP-binding protein
MIEAKGLTKVFKNVVAVNHLDLKVAEGDTFGFIGPNGAGKTTTLRMLATLLRPTFGDATIDGHSITFQAGLVRPIIGFMPDFFGVYGDMRVDEYLEFFAACYRIPQSRRRRLIADILELTDLSVKQDSMVESLSRGMKQRLALARVLINDPKVLLLDEPASGLDPRARIEIRELLRELTRMGKTIFISSHILSELQELCNTIGIIEKGRLLYCGAIRDLMRQVQPRRTLEIELSRDADKAQSILQAHPQILSATFEDNKVQVELAEGTEDVGFVARDLALKGFSLVSFREKLPDLEAVFMALTKGVVA